MKKTISRLGWAFTALMAVTLIVQFAVSFVASSYFPTFLEAPIAVWMLTQLPLYLCAFPVYLLIVRTIPDTCVTPEKKNLSVGRWLKYLMIAFAFMIAGNFISAALITAIQTFKSGEVVNGLGVALSSSSPWATALVVAVLVPIGEEIIFRYLPYKKLGGFGDKVYVLITSFAFALFHGNLYQLVYAFLIGTVLAYCYARTGKLLYSILLHMAINAYGSVLAPAAMAAEQHIYMLILAFALYLSAGFGVAFLIRSRGKVGYWGGTIPLSSTPVKDTFLNVGFLVYTLFILLVILAQTFLV